MLSTWVADSWRTFCAATRASFRWSARTPRGSIRPRPDHVALPEPVDLAVIDVSFISLTRVLAGVRPRSTRARRDRGAGQAAVRGRPGRRAARRCPRRGRPAARRSTGSSATPAGSACETTGEIESPLLGPKGNREFLVHLRRRGRCVERIGFAFNPTKPAAVELRDRALAWCTATASSPGRRKSQRHDAPGARAGRLDA